MIIHFCRVAGAGGSVYSTIDVRTGMDNIRTLCYSRIVTVTTCSHRTEYRLCACYQPFQASNGFLGGSMCADNQTTKSEYLGPVPDCASRTPDRAFLRFQMVTGTARGIVMFRKDTFGMRVSEEERKLISAVAARLQRDDSDMIRLLVRNVAEQLGVSASATNERKTDQNEQLQAA